MFKEKQRILLAEDDPNLGGLLKDYLQNEGYEISLCCNGSVALRSFHENKFDLCLLDVMMPELDGFSVAKEIRKTDKKIPLIFITAKSLKEDKLKGYSIGADDYITKPFDEQELLWKIRALTRRNVETSSTDKTDPVLIGRYLFDPGNQSLTINNDTKRLTEKECKILSYISERRNKLIKREDLLMELWGENDYFFGRSLDVFISKIRKYLKSDEDLSIENVFGVGFIFNVKESKSILY